MSESTAKRGRGRPTKGPTAMTAAERQAARRRRLREAERTLIDAREVARMICKWSDLLYSSARHGKPWQVEHNAYRLRRSATELYEILLC